MLHPLPIIDHCHHQFSSIGSGSFKVNLKIPVTIVYFTDHCNIFSSEESVVISTILSIVETDISYQKASTAINWDGVSSEKKLYT